MITKRAAGHPCCDCTTQPEPSSEMSSTPSSESSSEPLSSSGGPSRIFIPCLGGEVPEFLTLVLSDDQGPGNPADFFSGCGSTRLGTHINGTYVLTFQGDTSSPVWRSETLGPNGRANIASARFTLTPCAISLTTTTYAAFNASGTLWETRDLLAGNVCSGSFVNAANTGFSWLNRPYLLWYYIPCDETLATQCSPSNNRLDPVGYLTE
jgi:hypothetical protein